jgi:hypothetical protein
MMKAHRRLNDCLKCGIVPDDLKQSDYLPVLMSTFAGIQSPM